MDIYVWHISAKGNQYLKVGRHLCVVGQSKLGWWALVSDEFLENKFDSEVETNLKRFHQISNWASRRFFGQDTTALH